MIEPASKKEKSHTCKEKTHTQKKARKKETASSLQPATNKETASSLQPATSKQPQPTKKQPAASSQLPASRQFSQQQQPAEVTGSPQHLASSRTPEKTLDFSTASRPAKKQLLLFYAIAPLLYLKQIVHQTIFFQL